MRHLFTVLFILSVLVSISAQDIASVDFSEHTELYTMRTAMSSSGVAEFRAKQTQQAAAQLTAFIAEHVAYDEVLESYGIEGSLNIEFVLAKDGTIVEKNISNNNSPIARLIEKSIINLTSVDYDGLYYIGVRKLVIPVAFSL